MKITFTRTKSSTTLYVTKSYRRANGKYSSKVIERLGTLDEIKHRSGDQDPVEWAKEYAKKLTLEEKNANESATITFSAQNTPPKDKKKLFNAGYLFLNKIYNELNIKDICSKISARHKFKYDLNDLVSNLIFSRILFPSSKKSTFEDSRKYIFPAKYDLQHVYRALSVLAQENDTIQAEVLDRKSVV